ncbi:MAG: glutamine synthetase [Chloroflexales bacterium]|nr:glutamine synthetase [Chloroflexales bacterium]
MEMELSQILRQIDEQGVEVVRFEQSDTHGISRSKLIPARHVGRYAEDGLNFLLGHLGFDAQGGVAPGTGYLEERGFPDSRIFPDLTTFRLLPWLDATARLICEPLLYDGTLAAAAPRYVARRQLEALAQAGYRIRTGYEYECYLVRADGTPPYQGIQIFASLRNEFDPAFIRRLILDLRAVDVDIITANAEYGPGQQEINFAPGWGIAGADAAFSFKQGLKEIALLYGYQASFMTRPYGDQSSSGCHFHHSLAHSDGGNAFFDPAAPDGLSRVARGFMAGQIAHAPALAALFAPTVNCAKRYRLYSFAPTNATWGYENRTVGIRVKGVRGESTHLENRIPCAASNPYLVLAGVVAAGLDGLSRELEPPAPSEGIAYGLTGVTDLPISLGESLDALEADAPLCEALGPEFVKLFVAVKRHEIAKARAAIASFDSPAFRDHVDPWERAELFEFL